MATTAWGPRRSQNEPKTVEEVLDQRLEGLNLVRKKIPKGIEMKFA
jgi:hypothetical protein